MWRRSRGLTGPERDPAAPALSAGLELHGLGVGVFGARGKADEDAAAVTRHGRVSGAALVGRPPLATFVGDPSGIWQEKWVRVPATAGDAIPSSQPTATTVRDREQGHSEP